MSGKVSTRDASGQLVKMPGWFSWRHETSEAHRAASAKYRDEHGPTARRRRAVNRPPFPHGAERYARGCRCLTCAEATS